MIGGAEEGWWVNGWMDGMSTPPQGGGVIKHPSIHPATHHLSAAPPGSSNPAHSCLPPPERGLADGDGDDVLTQATSISSITIRKTLEKAISEAVPGSVP